MLRSTVCGLPLVMLTVCGIAFGQIAPPRMSTPGGRVGLPIAMCKSSQMSIATDGKNGDFDGMSHSGALLVLRNISETACQVEAIPRITFANSKGTLEAAAELPGTRFMHPGPVVLPITVEAGAEVTSTLRWVSGEVFDKSVCIDPTKLSVEMNGKAQTTVFAGHMCGNKPKGVVYQMTRFATGRAGATGTK